MARPVVLLTHPMGAPGEAMLGDTCELVLASATDHPTLRREIAPADALVVRAFLPDDLFDHAPRLRAVARQGTGVDLIPVAAATRHGILVANAPGINVNAVAEYVLAQMLALARRLDPIDRALRAGPWDAARAISGDTAELAGKTVGIVGIGAIGGRVGALAHAFGMRVLGHRRRLDLVPEFAEPAELDRLFAEADFVVLTCPLDDATRGLASAARIAAMRPGAYIVNVSRGAVVDEAALVAALEAGAIAGAALDVFAEQPLAQDHPLRTMENVRLSPHLAGLTREAFEETGRIAAQEILRILAGERPVNFVNPDAWDAAGERRRRLGR